MREKNSELAIALFDLVVMFSLNLNSKMGTDISNFRQIVIRNGLDYKIDTEKDSKEILSEIMELLKNRISYLFRRSIEVEKNHYQIEYRFDGEEVDNPKEGKSIYFTIDGVENAIIEIADDLNPRENYQDILPLKLL